MRILMITDNLGKGGKERRMLELIRFLDIHYPEFLIDLVILRKEIHYNTIFELKNTNVIILERKIKKDPTIFYKIFSLCKRKKYNLIHSWGSMPSVYAIPSVFFLKIPLVNAMIANSKCKKFDADWIRLKLTYPFSSIVLANSKAGLSAFGVKKKCAVVYNGFNFDRVKFSDDKDSVQSLFRISTKFVVGMVAAFHPRKDYFTFLETASEIVCERDDITFLAIGDGELKEGYEKKYSHPHIIFTGNIQHVEKIMSLFDIGVLLTNTDKHLEGISNSILEMMAMGIPVIATKGGGTNEIIEHMQTGILIDSFSKIQLKNYLYELMDNSNLKRSLGANASNKVKSEFSIEEMCTKTVEIYKTLDN